MDVFKMSFALNALDYFAQFPPVTSSLGAIPDRIQRSERLFQRRVLAAILLSHVVITCCVFATSHHLYDANGAQYSFVVFISMCLYGAFAMKWWPHRDLLIRVLVLVFLYMATQLLLFQEGGIELFGHTPLMLLPVVALALLGTEACFLTTIAALGSLNFWYYCKVSGMEMCEATRPRHELWLQFRSGFTALLIMHTALALTLRTFSDGLRQDLCEALLQLEKARNAAEAGSQAKSSFLAHMSHELKTPLNGIIGMAELLLQSPLSAMQRPYAETVYNCGKDLLMVINGILDFCRLEAKKLQLIERPFDLYSLVKTVAQLMSRLAAEKNLELVFCIPQIDYEPTHEGADHTVISRQFIGDEGRIRQILINLVGNAIKFSSNGVVKVFVDVDMTNDAVVLNGKVSKRPVRFTVTDFGVGIPLDVQPLLFQEFSQADISTTRQYGGTGLGLSITKMLVQLMDGEINLHSEGSDKGCTVSFVIPLTVCEQEPHLTAASTIQKPVLNSSFSVSLTNPDLQTHVLNCLKEYRYIENSQSDASITEPGSSLILISDKCALVRETVESKRDSLHQPLKVLLLTNAMELLEVQSTVEMMRDNHVPFLLTLKPFMGQDLRDAYIRLSDMGSPTQKPLELACSTNLVPLSSRSRVGSECVSESDQPDTANGFPSFSCVLVAEDNLVNRKLIGYQLRQLGCRYAFAEDGLQALEMYRRDLTCESYQFGLILMDLHMPRLDGLATTKAIRSFHTKHVEYLQQEGLLPADITSLSSLQAEQIKRQYPALVRIRIASVTADTSAEAKRKGVECGVDEFIDKPVALETLRRVLESSVLLQVNGNELENHATCPPAAE